MFHMIALEQTFVNGSLQKFFLLLLPFQIESILSVICLLFLHWIFQRWKIQFWKKRTAVQNNTRSLIFFNDKSFSSFHSIEREIYILRNFY